VFGLLIIVHVIISAGLVLSILMQSAKGEGLASAFGGGSFTGAVFGGRGAATFLSRATTVLAIAFFISCLTLTVLFPSGGGIASRESAVQKEAQKALQQQPVQTGDEAPATQQQPTQTQTTPRSILPPAPDTGKGGGGQ
jgi:preprotein translocase subunit SecG